MRSLPFLPLAYIAGPHGFVMIAPYLVAFYALSRLIERRRRHTQIVPA